MAIPDYQSIMLPLLKYASDGEIHYLPDAYERISNVFELTDEERKELLPSGRQTIIKNRVGWAKTYMLKAGLFEAVKRGYFRITDRGKDVLAQKLQSIDVEFLSQFPEFMEFRSASSSSGANSNSQAQQQPSAQHQTETSPEEALETAYQGLRSALAAELLEKVKNSSPSFFETLVVDLIVKMGYGGSRKEAGQAVGSAGDGGIDGIIKDDRLGLDIIYIQAKRWDNTTVGRPEIQKFAGALQGQRAKKGIFLTTSSFSRDAEEYVKVIETKIILIDGKRVAELMIDHNVGVSSMATYEIKRIDSDYFEED